MPMTCEEAKPLLAELAGEAPAESLAQAGLGLLATEAAEHAVGCAPCRAHVAQLDAAVKRLALAGQLELPAGFERELHRRLVAAGPPPLPLRARVRRWMQTKPLTLAGAAAALSALLAVAGTLTAVERGGAVAAVASAAQFKVPSEKVALVKIDFASERAIEDVSFEIQLPDGLRFYSGGQELAARSFQWQGRLGAGSNVVPVAVKGSRPGRYRVTAHATGRNLDVSQDVVLEVTT